MTRIDISKYVDKAGECLDIIQVANVFDRSNFWKHLQQRSRWPLVPFVPDLTCIDSIALPSMALGKNREGGVARGHHTNERYILLFCNLFWNAGIAAGGNSHVSSKYTMDQLLENPHFSAMRPSIPRSGRGSLRPYFFARRFFSQSIVVNSIQSIIEMVEHISQKRHWISFENHVFKRYVFTYYVNMYGHVPLILLVIMDFT